MQNPHPHQDPHPHQHTTPPECFTNSPPTPPPIAENEKAQNSLSYDFFPLKSRFVIRRPLDLHIFFTLRVADEIQRQLSSIQATPSAEFAKEIYPAGVATLELPDDQYSTHSPDAQFHHEKARYPGVVIEVSYPQKRKDLRRLADEYILGSYGDIRVVVGLDIEYENGKQTTLSIWRPSIITDEAGEEVLISKIVTNEVFRRTDGTPTPSRGLKFRLHDFATDAMTGVDLLHDLVVISPQKLCSLLEHAEAFAVRRSSVEELAQRDE